MFLNNGKELMFWIDSLPFDEKNSLYLTYTKSDLKGMKFTGDIPLFWEYDGENTFGPNLYDEDDLYRVIDVDYQNNYIWLEKI